MNSALAKRQEQLQDTLRNELRKEKFSLRRLKWRQIWHNGHIRKRRPNVKSSAYYSSVTPNIRRV